MDDVGKARARKFAESLRDASWVIDDDAAGARNAVGFWLYSYNLVAGPRLVGQLTLDGYRAMQGGEDLKNLDGLQPADVLGATLSAYDALPERSRNAGESQTVISALSLYAPGRRCRLSKLERTNTSWCSIGSRLPARGFFAPPLQSPVPFLLLKS